MRKKSVWLLVGVLCCLFLVGCGSKKSFTEENFGLTTTEQENYGEFVIALNIDKAMVTVDYELSENGAVKSTGKYEESDNGLLKENKITNKTPGEYEYVFTVKDEDGNKLSKGVSITVLDKSKDESADSKDTGDKSNNDKNDSSDASSEVAWVGDSKEYQKDDKVSFNGKTYKCIQGHTSQDDWTPTNAASLWKEFK